jgi:TIR domain
MSSAKPIIFISYAHADEPEKPRGEEVQWLTFVMRFLRPAVKSGAFTMWVDRQMPGGTEWDEEIDRELRACDVFVLLVSASSMGSDYIIDKELEIAGARRAAANCIFLHCSSCRRRERASTECASSIFARATRNPSRAIR